MVTRRGVSGCRVRYPCCKVCPPKLLAPPQEPISTELRPPVISGELPATLRRWKSQKKPRPAPFSWQLKRHCASLEVLCCSASISIRLPKGCISKGVLIHWGRGCENKLPTHICKSAAVVSAVTEGGGGRRRERRGSWILNPGNFYEAFGVQNKARNKTEPFGKWFGSPLAQHPIPGKLRGICY